MSTSPTPRALEPLLTKHLAARLIVTTALAFARKLGTPCALCGAPGASAISEAKVVDPYLREQLTRGTRRHQRRILSAGTPVCEDCDRGVFFLPSAQGAA